MPAKPSHLKRILLGALGLALVVVLLQLAPAPKDSAPAAEADPCCALRAAWHEGIVHLQPIVPRKL